METLTHDLTMAQTEVDNALSSVATTQQSATADPSQRLQQLRQEEKDAQVGMLASLAAFLQPVWDVCSLLSV